MGAMARRWLTGLLAGLVALALVQAPAEHTRAVLGQAQADAMHAAMPHGMHGHGKPAERHDQHHFMPACMACVLMGAPGTDGHADTVDRPTLPSLRAEVAAEAAAASPRIAGAPQRARAPAAGSIA